MRDIRFFFVFVPSMTYAHNGRKGKIATISWYFWWCLQKNQAKVSCMSLSLNICYPFLYYEILQDPGYFPFWFAQFSYCLLSYLFPVYVVTVYVGVCNSTFSAFSTIIALDLSVYTDSYKWNICCYTAIDSVQTITNRQTPSQQCCVRWQKHHFISISHSRSRPSNRKKVDT